MNKIFSVFMILMFLFSSLLVFAEEEYKEEDFFTSKTRIIEGEPNLSFWNSLFRTRTFSFVTTETSQSVYDNLEVRTTLAPMVYRNYGGVVGGICFSGEYVVPFISDTSGNFKTFIFSNPWVKNHQYDNLNLNDPAYSSWLPAFMDSLKQWNDGETYYGYMCIRTPDDQKEFIGKICLDDRRLCDNAFYWADGDRTPDCALNEITYCNCASGKCVETARQPPKASVGNLRINGQTGVVNVYQDEYYDITGVIRIQGDCVDCVVETGGEFYGTMFSTITSRKGACGDDLTIGAKFSASNKAVSFRLTDIFDTKPAGRYEVPVIIYSGCGGTELARDTFKVNLQEPIVNMVTCYACSDGRMIEREFPNECPRDWSRTEVNCRPQETTSVGDGVVCYYCEDGRLRETEYPELNNCPQGMSENTLTCSKTSTTQPTNKFGADPEAIYQCQMGSRETFCEMVCCPTNGDFNWQFSLECSNPVGDEFCPLQPTDIGAIILIIIVVLGAVGGVAYIFYKKQK